VHTISDYGDNYGACVDCGGIEMEDLQFACNLKLLNSLKCLTPKIPWDQKLVDCCLGSLCEEK
jgi:hypothetical protein